MAHRFCAESCVWDLRHVLLVCAPHLLATKVGRALFSSLASHLQYLCLFPRLVCVYGVFRVPLTPQQLLGV